MDSVTIETQVFTQTGLSADQIDEGVVFDELVALWFKLHDFLQATP
jgi:hypothetical protein